MAHRSWCAEHPGTTSNERLEFLGDAVLGWVVADLAYRRYTDLPEGKLTDVRKSVVNAVGARRGGRRARPRRRPAARQGRGRRRRPGEAVDPVRRAGGGDRRRLRRRRARRRPRRSIERLLGHRLRRRGRAPRPARPQDAAAGAGRPPVRRGAGLRHPARGPDHAKRFFATVLVGGEVRARARAGRRRWPSRRPPAEACADSAAAPPTDADA